MRLGLVALLLAYVMPAASVLKHTAKERNDLALSALRVEGAVTVPAAAAADVSTALGVTTGPGELTLVGAISMRLPARCRLELTSVDSTKAVAAISSNGKRRTEGSELPALQVAVDQICATLALRSAGDGEAQEALERHLKSLKIDTRLTSLARYDGTLAYVVGNAAAGSPQFWVYKNDQFNPARVRFTDDKGVAWDVKFKDYASQASDAFPRLVEVWKGDALQLKFTTLNSDTKPKLEDNLF